MKVYNVDLNTTNRCNLRCSYCFTYKNNQDIKDHYDIMMFVQKLIREKVENGPYDLVNVNFWGGEPSLNERFIAYIINNLDENPIKYFIFSNGYKDLKKTNHIWHLLNKYKNRKIYGEEQLRIQISFDGRPVHDILRRTKDGGYTSFEVRKNIAQLAGAEIPFVIKSTITPNQFQHMFNAYHDIGQLRDELSCERINYFPTIDYYSSPDPDANQVYKSDLEKSLIKIAQSELKREVPIFKWFDGNRALCSAGRNMIAVDVDGNIFMCHGCLYGKDKEDHRIGHIKDINIIDKIQNREMELSNGMCDEKECRFCEVSYCLRCNHAKYVNSNRDNYLEKWRDFKNQPDLCEYYRINHRVALAYHSLRRKNGLYRSHK